MKAAVREAYGPPELIRLEEVPVPAPGPRDVLLKVAAVSLNASDWECLTGTPVYARLWGFFTPRFRVLGSDLAGTVTAVGKSVTRFKPGDEVFGDAMGTFGGLAEYACAPEQVLKHKPAGLSFEVASTLLQSAAIAIQGLCERGELRKGQRLLINGGGGGSGSLGIQLAKWIGAEVTAVDNYRKLGVMRELGADHVIDYAQQDFARGNERYDLILDLFATRSVLEIRRVLTHQGRYLAVGGHTGRLLELASLGSVLSASGKKVGVLTAHQNRGVDRMCQLVTDGIVRPVIDRTFPLTEAAEAIRYLGEGRALGKVVVRG